MFVVAVHDYTTLEYCHYYNMILKYHDKGIIVKDIIWHIPTLGNYSNKTRYKPSYISGYERSVCYTVTKLLHR